MKSSITTPERNSCTNCPEVLSSRNFPVSIPGKYSTDAHKTGTDLVVFLQLREDSEPPGEGWGRTDDISCIGARDASKHPVLWIRIEPEKSPLCPGTFLYLFYAIYTGEIS
ncbi:hypothetical protein CDAR_534501 [Caerostris darwini]|uniref:Uncharacterized protein n=1 Tax=Caerostris darwini TaxID=1538125 RepID=A0AAV4MGT1_9ARAC|nr:hypothetical protein CDAR_534501 [Caerostris darwini]